MNSMSSKFHILSIYFTVLNIKLEKFRYQKPVSFSALNSLEVLTLKYIELEDWKDIEI